MSVIQAVSNAYYTIMSHNAAYSMMQNNMARMSLLNNLNFQGLYQADKYLTLQNLNNQLMYKIANSCLENKKLNTLA